MQDVWQLHQGPVLHPCSQVPAGPTAAGPAVAAALHTACFNVWLLRGSPGSRLARVLRKAQLSLGQRGEPGLGWLAAYDISVSSKCAGTPGAARQSDEELWTQRVVRAAATALHQPALQQLTYVVQSRKEERADRKAHQVGHLHCPFARSLSWTPAAGLREQNFPTVLQQTQERGQRTMKFRVIEPQTGGRCSACWQHRFCGSQLPSILDPSPCRQLNMVRCNHNTMTRQLEARGCTPRCLPSTP